MLLRAFCLTCLNVVAAGAAAAQPRAEEIWRSDRAARPEAVHVTADGRWAFIGNQGEDDDPGFIARMDLEAGTYAHNWAEGFDGPLGIVSGEGVLFFVDAGDAVIALDLETGERRARYPGPDGHEVLNDMAIDEDGRLWVTDSRADKLFLLQNGVWTEVFSGGDFDGANGVEYVAGWVYVVCSSRVGNLIRIDPDTLEYDVLLRGEGSLDGVITDGRGGLILSDIPGRLLHWSEAHGLVVLDGYEDEDIMLNSIGGTPDGRYVFVPHWEQSRLSLYRMHYPGD